MALLIDFEGIDGSGKGTQAQALCRRLQQAGIAAQLLSFPRYESTLFGQAIGEYLNGRFGGLEQVHPFLVSLLFAGDRFESKGELLRAMESNAVVVLDRYVPSNVAHQASKRGGAERAELTRRILHIEHEIYGLPRPDLILLLSLPVEIAQELVARKAARSYTTRSADIQEADRGYMQNVRDVYLELACSQPDWRVVECCSHETSSGVETLRDVEDIADEVWRVVEEKIASGQRSAVSDQR